MDPALWELLRAEADDDPDRVLEAIVRLSRPGLEIPGVRIVARFGTIATCRIRARDVTGVWARPDVVSLKAARGLSPGTEGPATAGPGTAARDADPSDVRRPPGLARTGRGVVVASVDWGVDVDSAAFRRAAAPADAGGTRFLAFWDQRDQATGPRAQPYGYGAVHDRTEIDAALHDPRPYQRLGYHPAIADRSGRGSHGTHVLDIAAGNGQAGGPAGVAPEADLAFVHLADRATGGLANLGDSVRLLEAVDFISRTAGSRPCVINISAGRTCGPKDGSTLVERALDELLAATPGRFVVNSAGNYFGWRTHACGVLAPGESRSLAFVVSPGDVTLNELEIWYDGADEFAVRVDPPGYAGGRPVRLGERSDLLLDGQMAGRVYHRKHDPNNGDHHIVVYLDPVSRAGTWTVTLEARRITSGRFHAWIERDDTCRGCQARFTPGDSSTVTTIGTITTSHLPLVVGAYDGHDPGRPPAAFSSSGPSRDLRPKPDLAAPGTDVLAARSASATDRRNPGLLVRKSGTSMATPHVSGAVALCLETDGRLTATEIRALVLGSCDPAGDADMPGRLGHGYLNIPRMIAHLEQGRTAPSAKEQTMNADDNVVLLAAAPATAYREYLYRPDSRLARWIDDRFEVVATPGQRVGQPLRPGDILLEIAIGRPGPGRCLVLEDPGPEPGLGRLSARQLLLRPRKQAEMSDPLPVEPLPVATGDAEDAGDAGAPPWTGTPEQLAFRDQVLQAHLARSLDRRGEPQRDLDPGELETVPGTDIKTAQATARAAGRLLAAATADLRAAQVAGDQDALVTTGLTLTSGYRSSQEQRTLWLAYFANEDGYYNQTRTARGQLPDGPHSAAAVAYLLRPKDRGGFGLADRIAAPGYSNHQGGIAVDFYQQRDKGHAVRNRSDEASRARWRATWFQRWLAAHAADFGFRPLASEEWHWEYRPAAGSADDTAADSGSAAGYLDGKLWTFTATPLSTRTAVFCPRAALGRDVVDVLVFAHGLLGGCPRPAQVPAGFITDAPFRLGQILDASGRAALLVVPYLDWTHPGGEQAFGAGHPHWHALAWPGHFNDLVTQALAEAGRVQGTPAPSLGRLIITGHSQAYDFLEPLAAYRRNPAMSQGPLARLSLVAGFDTSYAGQVDHWTEWLAQDPGLTFHLFYRPGQDHTGPVGDAFYTRRGGRLLVTRVAEQHCQVPATRLPSVLASSASSGDVPDKEDAGPGEDTAAVFKPPSIPDLTGGSASSHTITWGGRSVEVHSWPGTGDQTVLILGGVHQDERKALALSGELLQQLTAAQAKPFNRVVFVPDLFGGRKPTDRKIEGIPTNRNFPRQDESLAAAAKRGNGVPRDAEPKERPILPENVILLALVEAVKPRASLSIHSHRVITSPAEVCTEGAAGITVDPRPGGDDVGDYLAKEMALAAAKAGVPVPGNRITGESAITRYPTEEASHEPGVTFGQWGSHRGGMNQYLVETEDHSWPDHPSAAQRAEIRGWTQVIWSTFLADPRDVTAATARRAKVREQQASTAGMNW